jgi:translation initiation factor 2B subunit (eIF-2B alpha/beta/delta family)
VDAAWARVERVAADHESGAAQIARRAAAALAGLPREQIQAAVEILIRGHPSMAPMWRLANDVASVLDPAEAARDFLTLLDSDREAAAVVAALLPDRVVTLSYSSTVALAIRLRRPKQTVCMRSEPGGEGWRVAEETRDCTWPVLMEDEEALEKVPGDAVLVGADAVTPEGVVNKVKTAALAEAARSRGIPRYAVAGETKFIGADLPLVAGFEVAALELFTGVAAPDALLRSAQAAARARSIVLRPELQRLLRELSG